MICCGLITYQDFTQRRVLWILFPLLGLLLGTVHFLHSSPSLFLGYALLNGLLVSAVILILYLYTKGLRKKAFLNASLGLGDILFFYVLGLAFPTLTFITLFACSLIFSLIAFLLLKKGLQWSTVPLAGLMSIFLTLIIAYSLFFNSPNLYLL
ncbi:hypothetical protein WIW50_02080 [Flavobacteriaceae bacterium 3-367]|uniref:hypothetical protein n=1 Tax=Eudoraea algarum TaxID=3417568 RepID=UPI003294D284